MIVSVLVRRLREGRTYEDFVTEWEADEGFDVPTRVFHAQSLEDPRDIITIGFVAVSARELAEWLAAGSEPEAVRHERIDTVIEFDDAAGHVRDPRRARLHGAAAGDRHVLRREPPLRAGLSVGAAIGWGPWRPRPS